MNSTKLEVDLQSSLGSLGQLLRTNIKFSKVVICKLHFLKFVSMLTKEKKCFLFEFEILQCLIYGGPKNLQSLIYGGKHGFLFLSPLKRTL
jgi:hypothetical protein